MGHMVGHMGHIAAAPQITPADVVIARLEEAGATLLALPNRGYGLGMRGFWPEIMRDAAEAYGYGIAPLRAAAPSPRDITAMDAALAWLSLIPDSQRVLRRVVGARALVSPVTGRALFSWRRLGVLVGADHRAVQRWHGDGIAVIVEALQARK